MSGTAVFPLPSFFPCVSGAGRREVVESIRKCSGRPALGLALAIGAAGAGCVLPSCVVIGAPPGPRPPGPAIPIGSGSRGGARRPLAASPLVGSGSASPPPHPQGREQVTSSREQWRSPGDGARPALRAAGTGEGAVGPPARALGARGSGRAERRCQILKELDEYYEKFKREADGTQKRRALHCIQRALIRSQELGDEKIQLVSQMVELVENRARQVDSHVELLEAHQEAADATGHSKAGQDKAKNEAIAQAEKPNNKRSRRQRNNENRENAANNHDHDDVTSGTPKEKKAKASKKKKRSKAKAEREASPADLPIDPNEPTYCLCNQVSYGEMIGCDNDECPIEWFHFSCVGLSHKPKGKWYCPKCRGESEKTMDKALEKSKRERAYNR
ncbi:inhibitor of growth protein 1 isoform X1 [Cervus canadensis]|uniref:inhibitor of growth protein 1 isoform X1 n=1 Tax=Cervus canadensis TaxID=1574408 RepID=UPI001C9E4B52|nr:inhibitor of growth protein 1 isoform X1 [Cervus canadensis]